MLFDLSVLIVQQTILRRMKQYCLSGHFHQVDIFIISQRIHGLGSWSRWRKEDVTWFVNCAVARVSQKLVTGYFRLLLVVVASTLKGATGCVAISTTADVTSTAMSSSARGISEWMVQVENIPVLSGIVWKDALVGGSWWRKMITIFACQNFHGQKLLRTSESWI